MYDYRANINNVVDGDTLDLDIDFGFRIHQGVRVRLLGINTDELHDKDVKKRERAMAARDFVKVLLPVGREVRVFTQKDDTEKYGRYLATIYLSWDDPSTLKSVNQTLLDQGLADPYDGGKRT